MGRIWMRGAKPVLRQRGFDPEDEERAHAEHIQECATTIRDREPAADEIFASLHTIRQMGYFLYRPTS